MKPNQIRDVVAIVDRGSLRAAAQQHELGIDLFERHARGMALTPLRK